MKGSAAKHVSTGIWLHQSLEERQKRTVLLVPVQERRTGQAMRARVARAEHDVVFAVEELNGDGTQRQSPCLRSITVALDSRHWSSQGKEPIRCSRPKARGSSRSIATARRR